MYHVKDWDNYWILHLKEPLVDLTVHADRALKGTLETGDSNPAAITVAIHIHNVHL